MKDRNKQTRKNEKQKEIKPQPQNNAPKNKV